MQNYKENKKSFWFQVWWSTMLNCLLAMNWLLFYRQRGVVFECKLEFLPIRKLLQCINCFHKAIHANISHACHSELYNSVWPHFIISIHGLSDSFCHFCGQFNFNLLKRHFLLLKKCMYICVRLGSCPRFSVHVFYFFFCLHLLTLGDDIYCCERCIHCSHTMYILFMY